MLVYQRVIFQPLPARVDINLLEEKASPIGYELGIIGIWIQVWHGRYGDFIVNNGDNPVGYCPDVQEEYEDTVLYIELQ